MQGSAGTTYLKTLETFMTTRRSLVLAALALAVGPLALPAPVLAQANYPDKPIKFIVPYAPGGFPDTVARVYAQQLTARLGQSVVVDNRPGANGVVAAQALAAAPKDGYTFLVTDGSMFSINPAVYKNLGYDFKRDFVPVYLAARASLYMAINPKVPANTLQEFITLAKARPGTLNYGSSGIGSTHHLTMEAIKSLLGLEITHVPFKGTGQAVPALIGGQVDVLFSALPSLAGFVKSGQVKLIASNAAQRSTQAPNIPLIADIIPGFDFAPIVGVLAPSGTPQYAIDKLNAEMTAVSKTPALMETFNIAGIDPLSSSTADYGKAILAENERLAKAVIAANIKPE